MRILSPVPNYYSNYFLSYQIKQLCENIFLASICAPTHNYK